MDYKNGQNLRKNLKANVLQIFAFAFHIVTEKVGQRLNEVGNLLTCERNSGHNVGYKTK